MKNKRKKSKKELSFSPKFLIVSIIVVVCIAIGLGVYVYYNLSLTDEVVLEENSDNETNISYAPPSYYSKLRMLRKQPGQTAGGPCSSHDDCRSGHCNSNGHCA